MDYGVGVAGLITGLLVGLTGMGGGALTMPLLTLVFGVPPLAAVSTDLVANAVTKPLGAAVHLRRRTVNVRLAVWLCVGSVPCAAVGPLIAGALGKGSQAHEALRFVVGAAVLLAAVTLFTRMYVDAVRRPVTDVPAPQVAVIPTVLLGALAGLIVGTTSVGSGSIVIVCLLLLHPRLTSAQLVGTDLVQAGPMVAVAASGHVLVGDVHIGLVGSLLVGSIPGVLAGAWLSSRTPDAPIRFLLGGMLVATGLLMVRTGVLVAAACALASVTAAYACCEARRITSASVRRRSAPTTVRNEGEPR